MNKGFVRKFVAAAAIAGAAGTAQSALLGRDVNGNAVSGSSQTAVFLYDTDFAITWARNANINGLMNWPTAQTWASNLVIGRFDDWRLPTSLNRDGSGPTACPNCTSEMGHLWYAELGNSAGGPMANVGNFQNFQTGSSYWTSTESGLPPTFFAIYFEAFSGGQLRGDKAGAIYALAVRDGDVLAVPEASSFLLMGLGLIALSISKWRG